MKLLKMHEVNIVISFQSQYSLEAGTYAFTDMGNSKSTTRTDEITIPDPELSTTNSNIPVIRVLVKEKTQDSFKPITMYDIPSNIDSVKFLSKVTNTNLESPFVIRSQLLKFESDTTAARLMHYNNYSQGSLRYKGIDYGKKQFLQLENY